MHAIICDRCKAITKGATQYNHKTVALTDLGTDIIESILGDLCPACQVQLRDWMKGPA